MAQRARKFLSLSHPVYTDWVISLDNQAPAIFSKWHLNTVQAVSRVSSQYFWEVGWVTGHLSLSLSRLLLKHTLLVIFCAKSPSPHTYLREKARVYLDTIPLSVLQKAPDMQEMPSQCLWNEWMSKWKAVFKIKTYWELHHFPISLLAVTARKLRVHSVAQS